MGEVGLVERIAGRREGSHNVQERPVDDGLDGVNGTLRNGMCGGKGETPPSPDAGRTGNEATRARSWQRWPRSADCAHHADNAVDDDSRLVGRRLPLRGETYYRKSG